VRVFISSVRKGLEEERDSLPSLISALGHTPVRFEDFSAQATPSREACLTALESADACLLLLGPHYGHVFPETGQSATHDEWVHAQHKGIRRLVYLKAGVRFEPDQNEFKRIVEAYATGVFRDSFNNSVDLQAKVAQGLRDLDSKPSSLEFERLTREVTLNWIASENQAGPFANVQGSFLELHTLPVDHLGYSAREMERFIDSLVNQVRGTQYIKSDVALRISRATDHVAVSIDAGNERRSTWDQPQVGEFHEVRLYKTGQVSIRATLPRDGMGSILDPEVLPVQVAEMLRLTGALSIIQDGPVVVAIGVSSDATMSADIFDPNRSRTRAHPLNFGRSVNLRTEADESVSLAALEGGADEVAKYLSRALFAQLSI
jgi:Domain of unknown function (DUF4062)